MDGTTRGDDGPHVAPHTAFESSDDRPRVLDPGFASDVAEAQIDDLAALDGFRAAAIFGSTRQLVAGRSDPGTDIERIGILAGHVLANAALACSKMDGGAGRIVHVEAEHASIFAGYAPLSSASAFPGTREPYVALIVDSGVGEGMAKLRLKRVLSRMGETTGPNGGPGRAP